MNVPFATLNKPIHYHLVVPDRVVELDVDTLSFGTTSSPHRRPGDLRLQPPLLRKARLAEPDALAGLLAGRAGMLELAPRGSRPSSSAAHRWIR